MKNKVLLEIIGTQNYQDTDDKIEITTIGTFEETESQYILRYKEEQETPTKPVKTTVKIDKNNDTVQMIKSGNKGSCLVIEKSKRNLCQYSTEFGDLLMGIYGKKITTKIDKESGSFRFDYDVDINGAITSQNQVLMNFQKN